jgi:hypothetical protein
MDRPSPCRRPLPILISRKADLYNFMPTFTIADENLEDLIRRDIWQAILRDDTTTSASRPMGTGRRPLNRRTLGGSRVGVQRYRPSGHG